MPTAVSYTHLDVYKRQVIVYGLNNAMLFFALQFLLLISLFSFLLHSPPHGYVPPGFEERRAARNDRKRDAMSHLDEDVLSPLHVLKESRFWVLWVLLFIGAGAGLMVIGNLKPLAKLSMGEFAYLAIVILAVGDAAAVSYTHLVRKL